MKRVLIFPPAMARLRPVLSDRAFVLMEAIADKYSFFMRFSPTMHGWTQRPEVVLVYCGAHGREVLPSTFRLQPSVKVIYYMTGIHNFDDKTAEGMVKRGSAVLVTYYEAFCRRFPQLAGAPNVYHFPLCFAPQGRYSQLPYRNERIRRCLVTGHSTPKVYPLRHHIKGRIEAHSAKFQQFVIMRHPRFKKSGRLRPWEIPAALNESYAVTLMHFYCSVATASAYEYVLAKYFEIPAAGALLLAQHTPDLDRLGFTPDVHYIPIDEYDFAAKTSAALCGTYPGPVEQIRIDGMTFVRKNHGLKNRLELFGEIMKKSGVMA